MTEPFRLLVVLDGATGERLRGLLAEYDYAWVVESEKNMPIIRRLWAEEKGDSRSATPGVTSFAVKATETPEEALCQIACLLEDHHGEFAQEHPWTEICVLGARLTEDIEEAFRDLGATDFWPSPEGFLIVRAI